MPPQSTEFGRYTLERRLALGGMAEVFLAKLQGPEGFQKQVVVKRILPHLRSDARHVAMFLDEAKLAARFNHPNLVQVYELAQVDGQFFMAMEYIEGQDLATVLERNYRDKRMIPLDFAAYVVAQAARGLHYAHELRDDLGKGLQVVHRDVSPANILVTPDGGVKVVDFGIAKHNESAAQTAAGTLKGKFSYMSPEQAKGSALDRRSDVFSLGTVLYELLTVQPCFPGTNQVEVMTQIADGVYKDPRSYRPDLPEDLEDILHAMLETNRDHRIQTAEDVAMQMQAFLERTAVPDPESIGSYVRSLRRGNQDRLAVAGIGDDEVSVPEEYASPARSATKDAYRDILESRSSEIEPFDIPSDAGVHRPDKWERFGTFADKMREPRYWPTTLAAFALTLFVGAFVVVGVYRSAVDRPWDPLETITSVVEPRIPEPSDQEQIEAGVLQVMSEPAGATVLVDNQPAASKTPVTIDNLALGVMHRVVLQLEGHQTVSREVELQPGRLQSLLVVLPTGADPLREVQVTSEPTEAQVYVDGAKIEGVTPLAVTLRPGETHAIAVRKAGFSIVSKKADSAKVSTVHYKLEPVDGDYAWFTLDSIPATQVRIDDQSVGQTPVRRHKLPAGQHVVSFFQPKFGLKKTLRLKAVVGEHVRRKVVFRKGTVVFDVKPWADVFLAGEKLGTTPMPPQKLFEGSYALKLVNPTLGVERVIQLTVKPGKTKKIIESLQ